MSATDTASDAPTPTLSKGEQTRRTILTAAIARFGSDGYRATSVADIARHAGVGGTLVYAYFPNKEALFLAACDEDAAAVLSEGLSTVAEADVDTWREELIFSLLDAVQRHPLARRVLSGLEPDVTDRVLEVPALSELRKTVADRLRREQSKGLVRSDIDPDQMANGVVTILLSLLMSVVQVGPATAYLYGPDVAAVFKAAIEQPPPR